MREREGRDQGGQDEPKNDENDSENDHDEPFLKWRHRGALDLRFGRVVLDAATNRRPFRGVPIHP
jgi:hypothetical protein